MDDQKEKKSMTVAEAGRRGGKKVASERGRAFYEEIGKKGGAAVKAKYGHEFYVEMGKKGGQKVAERGRAFYEEIGTKGGQKIKALVEQGKHLSYAEMGKKGVVAKAKSGPNHLVPESNCRCTWKGCGSYSVIGCLHCGEARCETHRDVPVDTCDAA